MDSQGGVPLDVAGIASRLMRGLISLSEAEAEVADYRAFLLTPKTNPDRPPPSGLDGQLQALLGGWEELLKEVVEETNALRVRDLGRLAIAVSRLAGVVGATAELVGRRLEALGETREAIRFFEEAEAAGGEWALAATCRKLGCMVELGAYARAEQLAERVIDQARRDGRQAILAGALRWRARAREGLGRRETALPDAREALSLRLRSLADEVRLDGVEPEESFYLSLALIERSIGRYDEAFHTLEEGRALALASGEPHAAAYLLSEIGYTWMFAGDPQRAAAVLARAADEAERLDILEWAYRWRNAAPPEGSLDEDDELSLKFARALELMNAVPPRPDETRKLLLDCLAEAKRLPERGFEANVRNVLAGYYSDQGQWLQAEAAAREAIRTAEDANSRGAAMTFRINLANILLRRGWSDRGERELEEAISLGEALRSEAPSTELRQTRSVELARAYEQLAFLAGLSVVSRDGAESRPPQPERLFAIGQRSRGVNLARWLRLGDAVERAGVEDLVARLLALRGAEVNLEAAAADGEIALGPLDAERRARLRDFDRAASEHRIELDHEAGPRALSELKQIVDEGDCLLDMVAIEEGVCVTCVGPSRTAEVDFLPWPRPERLGLLEDWRVALRRSAMAGSQNQANGAADAKQRALARITELAEAMDAKLFGPLADHAVRHCGARRRLLVLPHRELFQFPFWRLERHIPLASVSIVPCPEALFVLRRRPRDETGDWLAFGDATNTLRGVMAELGALARHEPCEPSATVMFERLGAASLAHFACHGRFDARNPYRSGLVVARTMDDPAEDLSTPDPYETGCRLLTIADIVGRMYLPRCQLAVLSACQTGLPREHPASEFTSLPAALLVAGARNVVASLWAAHDLASMLLMREFYAALTDGVRLASPSSALAAARRRVAAMPRDEVRVWLGEGARLPDGERPFARPDFVDCFQHYGID
jgi:tetratricopeptide (TPR) repeat protein